MCQGIIPLFFVVLSPNYESESQRLEMASILIDKGGANIYIKDNYGKTVLDYAREKEYMELVGLFEYLLS